MPLKIRPIYGDILVKEENQEKDVAIKGSKMKNVVALHISDKWIRSVLQEQINNVVMASLDSPHDGCRNRVAPFDIDIGAFFNQKLAECIMVVDRCPLSRAMSVILLMTGQNKLFGRIHVTGLCLLYPDNWPQIFHLVLVS